MQSKAAMEGIVTIMDLLSPMFKSIKIFKWIQKKSGIELSALFIRYSQ